MLVDAVRAGGPPGRVVRTEIRPEDCSGPAELSLHALGVLETLQIALRIGMFPAQVTLWGAEPACLEPGLLLSPPLAAARDRVVDAILAEVAARTDSARVG
jgi:hydrogenase maturation protease